MNVNARLARALAAPLVLLAALAAVPAINPALAEPQPAAPHPVVTLAAAPVAAPAAAETEHLYRPTPWPLRNDSLTIHALTRDGEDIAFLPQGLDAISFAMRCHQESGIRTACGAQARAQIINFIAGKTLACRKRGEDIIACQVEGRDLADWLVRAGIAVPKGGAGAQAGAYAEALEEARSARRGLWSDIRMRSQNGRLQAPSRNG